MDTNNGIRSVEAHRILGDLLEDSLRKCLLRFENSTRKLVRDVLTDKRIFKALEKKICSGNCGNGLSKNFNAKNPQASFRDEETKLHRIQRGKVQRLVEAAVASVESERFTFEEVVSAVRKVDPTLNGNLNTKSVSSALRRMIRNNAVSVERNGGGRRPAVYSRKAYASRGNRVGMEQHASAVTVNPSESLRSRIAACLPIVTTTLH